ncbi:MAG: hypothetical protein MUO76_08705 [Anaerolineaceae bacterium]|nr:hypothetical protein [Anaerolineaceae bacterium]
MNGPAETEILSEYALLLFGAAKENREFPAVPNPFIVTNPQDYPGSYHGRDRSKSFQDANESPPLTLWDKNIALKKCGGDGFYINPPGFTLLTSQFQPEAVRVVDFRSDDACFTNEHNTNLMTCEYTLQWETFTRHNGAQHPWLTNFLIAPPKENLSWIFPVGEEEPLFQVRDIFFRIGADLRLRERTQFKLGLDNRAYFVELSGGAYCQIFTP